jgi:DNA-binding MarR family transcriptional regulator
VSDTQFEQPAHDAAGDTLPAGFGDDFGWLLAQCFHAHVTAMDRALSGLPHGYRGFQALYGAASCSARNQAELARQLGVDRTVMVYLVDDLEKADLVERIPDPADRRSRLIRATPTGVERLAQTRVAISAAEAELLRVLSEEDRERLRHMLRDVAAHQSTAADSLCDVAERVRREPC